MRTLQLNRKAMRYVLMLLVTMLCACNDSNETIDNSLPYPDYLSMGLQFVDSQGKDLSENVSMQFEGVIEGTDVFNIPADQYTLQCYIDGVEVSAGYTMEYHPGEVFIPEVKIEAIKRKASVRKTFLLQLRSYYGLKDWSSDHIYELEFVLRFPSLLGSSTHRVRGRIKARDLGNLLFKEMRFDGKKLDIDPSGTYVCKID